jgi:hypothetical protein
MGRKKIAYSDLRENLVEADNPEDLEDRMYSSRNIFRQWDGGRYTAFICFRIRIIGLILGRRK